MSRLRIHVFTSVKSFSDRSNATITALSGARVLSSMGYHVHISDESNYRNVTAEAINTMAHMAVADVLLVAKSTFSIAAGYLNRKCVIVLSKIYYALNEWIIVHG